MKYLFFMSASTEAMNGPSVSWSTGEPWLTGRPLFDAVLLFIFIASLVSFVRSWYRLRHVPGPFFHSISSLPTLRANLSGRAHEVLYDLTSDYGERIFIRPKLDQAN